MIYTKSKPDYVELDADFKPLPKLGHLSQKHPAYEAAEEAIGAGYAKLHCLPDFKSFRNAAGDADASMPPGGPDRYRDVTTQLMFFTTRDGHKAELKIYKSPNIKPNAALMYRMHGGAWCVGRHEVDGAENVYAATNKNLVVVSVDYRLAPEHPFPYPLNDSYDGLLWCKENASLLGVDPERIILSGSSAGANLAAALAIECREHSVTGVIAQVLHFPATCHSKFFPKHKYEFGSYIQNFENPVLSTLRYEACLDVYVPAAVPDHRHSPLLAKSLKGLPPTLIQCAGADILRDEAFAYAEALEADGVAVEVFGYQGLPHCFPVILETISETTEFYARYQKFLKRRQGIKTVAIYTKPDSASQHVAEADISFLLDGDATRAYLDGDQLIEKAKDAGAQAIIPGYGFLSEDAHFARSVAAAGLHFVGPSPESIEQFGLKHTARELALAAGVPVVPGTQGLLDGADDAVRAADGLGYPVMLKSTAGGGGMGLQTCGDEGELRKAFETVQSRGAALFKNAGVFLERYSPAAHHIEVQVFGNGQGKVAALGERECSIQRRHQKVIEECPSPFVAQKRPGLRKELCAAAISLAESVKYASAGTIEFLVDDEISAFFFLEMNTRLQVEHGVTEMVYGVDLVELMLRQADAHLACKGGLEATVIDDISRTCQEPKGHAVEVRVYAENPARDYAPSPGLLQQVIFHELPGTRIDTWVRAGITVSPHYDPLLAKVLHHAQSRSKAVEELKTVLSKSSICGPPTNLDFLLAILDSPEFESGNTVTQFLSTFVFRPPAIDVLAGGSYTLVEDYPGRPTIGKGFGHGGPMDPISFQIANALVGNRLGKEGLEITLTGPDLKFLADAVVSLTGAAISATLDGKDFPMWRRVRIAAGQRLTIGKTLSNAGCRSYLSVYGGFLNVAEWFGSKATVPLTLVGGYQGRPLATGDILRIVDTLPPEPEASRPMAVPDSILPKHQEHWVLHVMHGPYCEEYLSSEDIEMFYSTHWEVSHNAARGGIRLIGPRPKWARTSGGEGGSHPSNVIEYGYPIGGVNFTGDEPVIFPNDCPDFGGFVCPFTVVKADYWKVGQLRAGNTVKFVAVSLEDALWSRKANEAFVDNIVKWLASGSFNTVQSLEATPILEAPSSMRPAVIRLFDATPSRPRIAYRQGGDDYLLVDYGNGSFDINHKCRITALKGKLEASIGPIRFSSSGEGIYNTVCIGNSMMIYYNGLAIPQLQLLDYLEALEDELGDLSSITMPNRTFKLPVTFTHPRLNESIERYMANQRPYASYLPDNFKFVAENNGITPEEFRKLWLTAEFVCIGVGFFMALPLGLPADPRHRLNSPKMNPSRTFTPEGTTSWGGSCLAIYPVDCPGGYMLNGLTLPSCDKLGYKKGFSKDRPWLYEDMDVITFYEVSEDEYDREIALFRSGRYEFKVESTKFDMKRHNELLENVKEEVVTIKKKQEEAQEKMVKLEKELLAKWDEEKKASGVSMESIQTLLDDPNIEAIEAPVNANVWKVLVEEGQVLEKGQVATILEAMKMEINVGVDDRFAGSKIEKVLIQPNDIVQSGKPLVLVRTGN